MEGKGREGKERKSEVKRKKGRQKRQGKKREIEGQKGKKRFTFYFERVTVNSYVRRSFKNDLFCL